MVDILIVHRYINFLLFYCSVSLLLHEVKMFPGASSPFSWLSLSIKSFIQFLISQKRKLSAHSYGHHSPPRHSGVVHCSPVKRYRLRFVSALTLFTVNYIIGVDLPMKYSYNSHLIRRIPSHLHITPAKATSRWISVSYKHHFVPFLDMICEEYNMICCEEFEVTINFQLKK